MIEVFGSVSTNVQRVGCVLHEYRRIESRFFCCTIAKLNLDSGEFVEIPVCASIAAGCEICCKLVALETLIEIVEASQSFLVLVFHAKRFKLIIDIFSSI